MVAVVENEGKRVEEVEEVGVEMRVREEEQKEKDEAVVAPIPAPPPPPSAVARAVAFKSLCSKKESFKSLPNANQSAFWLKKCNVALARGDEEAACLALRTGISRKGATDGGIVREVERVGDDENERSDRGIGEDRGSRRSRSEDAERGRKYERNCE